MRAMILAAGLGERMQPLTANTPKPLLKVGDKSLIEHQIDKLAAAGVSNIVINHFHLGSQIEQALGDGSRYGIHISYSPEAIRLDTAGGIIKALPMLGNDCFIVVNADIWTDFNYAHLPEIDADSCLAHLVMVDNRDHHPEGDFCLRNSGLVLDAEGDDGRRLTFTGISVMHKKLFAGYAIQPRSVVPLLREAMAKKLVRGEFHDGVWIDVGTPQRLRQVNDLVLGRE